MNIGRRHIRLLGQIQKTLLLLEITPVGTLTFSCAGSLGSIPHRATWKGPDDRCIYSGFFCKRSTLKLEDLNVL